MSKIKSALELALEKTRDIKVDKEKIEELKYIKKGKIAVSKLIENPDYPVDDQYKGLNSKQKQWMKNGMLDTLLSYFILPKDPEALENFKKIEQAFYKVENNIKYLETIFNQLNSFFAEYMKEKERLLEMINQQYEPHLKRKEAELSKQVGREVKINPAQDPEYMSIVKNNVSQLEGKYQEVLSRAKKDLLETLQN
jgi:hypothetical protein